MIELTPQEKYDFKKQFEAIKEYSGRATEMISLYIPPSKQIPDVTSYLRNEYSQSSNIKSKSTMKNVTGAIESILSRLKYFKTPPPNGVVFFVGTVSTGNNQTTMVAHALQPPDEIPSFLYRCDSSFFTEPLEGMLLDKKSYGLIAIDRNEATIGMLKGKTIVTVKNFPSLVMGKHRQGGQSAVRFERLIEIAVHEFFKKVARIANDAFMAEEEMHGVIIGGPGSTKRFFAEENLLNHELRKRVLDLVDISYTDESGLREIVDSSKKMLSDIDLMKEKELVQKFLGEIRQHDGGLSAYGEVQVRHALTMGAVATILISENISKSRTHYKCNSCEHEFDSVHPNETTDKELVKSCPKCDFTTTISDTTDLVDNYYETAKETGTSVELISGDSEEGEMLLKAFGGIGAILRYKIE